MDFPEHRLAGNVWRTKGVYFVAKETGQVSLFPRAIAAVENPFLHGFINLAVGNGHGIQDHLPGFLTRLSAIVLYSGYIFFSKGFNSRLVGLVTNTVPFSDLNTLDGRLNISHG